MREIKFRAWDGQRIWKLIDGPAYSFKIYSDGSGRFGNEGGDDCLNFYRGENSEIKVMQYTGLKDKNGVEIYEGDIVRAGTVESKDGAVRNINVPVEYVRGVFEPIAYITDDAIEVIGNIYENPELLDGNKE